MRHYSCVDTDCLVEGNHAHVGESVQMIPDTKNYIDVESISGKGE